MEVRGIGLRYLDMGYMGYLDDLMITTFFGYL